MDRILVRNLLVLILMALLAVPPALPQSRRGRPPAPKLSGPTGEKALVELESRIFRAIRAHDTETLGGILAADFVYVSPRKKDLSRQQFLQQVKSFSQEIEWLGAEEMKIHMYNDIAVVTGIQNAKVRSEKTGLQSGDTAFTDVFRKSSGEWQLVMAFGADIASVPQKK